MAVVFSAMFKKQTLDQNFFIGALVITVGFPLIFGFIASLAIKNSPKCHLIINEDYIFLFVDDIEIEKRLTRNFKTFEKSFCVPNNVMIFNGEQEVVLPKILGSKSFKIFEKIKRIQIDKKMNKLEILLAWLD